MTVKESYERVSALLQHKDKELRRLSKSLYEHDNLDATEMDLIIRGKGLSSEKEKEKVRTWDKKTEGNYVI